jgi:excisionase family DNA binding protein
MDELLTPEEVAERLKIDIQTVRRYLREGRLKGHLLGRVWRVPESALAAMLEATSNQSKKRRKG